MLESLRNLTHQLRQQRNEPAGDLHFEIQLERENLLEPLEASGALPRVENPNPFDPVLERQKHEAWWQTHPREGKEFRAAAAGRRDALQQIRAGMTLASRK